MIIFITGKIGSGKSTIAEILVKEFGFTEYMFAGPLKRFACDIGFTKRQIYGTQEDKLEINSLYNISGREFMQKFASEVCRQFLPTVLPSMTSIWVKAAIPILEDAYKNDKNIVFSDVRFEDEIRLGEKYRAFIIKVARPSIDEVSKHISESSIDKLYCDCYINNDRTIEDLKADVRLLLRANGIKKSNNIIITIIMLLIVITILIYLLL